MGQYFKIVNLDKKEWIEPDGVKLWELCAGNSIRMLGYLLATNNWDGTSIVKHFSDENELERIKKELESLGIEYEVHIVDEKLHIGYVVPKLKYFGRWCGDRIVVLGDYAEHATNYKIDATRPSYDDLEKPEWRNITNEVVKEFNYFIELDELKVSTPPYLSPDMIITASGFQRNPKIKVRK